MTVYFYFKELEVEVDDLGAFSIKIQTAAIQKSISAPILGYRIWLGGVLNIVGQFFQQQL
jgi:hypothetical protein